jgi:hypothetical protein
MAFRFNGKALDGWIDRGSHGDGPGSDAVDLEAEVVMEPRCRVPLDDKRGYSAEAKAACRSAPPPS